MKHVNQLLFNFSSAYCYTFIAGILVSLAANIFVGALLSAQLPLSRLHIYLMTLALFISSLGAFMTGTLLETARREWEAGGSPKDPVAIRRNYIEKGNRGTLLWRGFLVQFVGPLYIVFIYIIT
jgi:hypothetical protein